MKKENYKADLPKAEFEAFQEITKKGKHPVMLKERRGLIDVKDLLGNKEATITRGRTIKRSLPFGESSISATCNVQLTCGQHTDTILKASQVALDIVTKILIEQDAPDMEEFMNESMKYAIRNRNRL